MMQEKEYSFEESTSRYLDNSMPEQEQADFLKFISENKEYSDLFEEYKDIWIKAGNTWILMDTDAGQDWDKVLVRMEKPDKKRNKSRNLGYLLPRIAALAIILFATAIIITRYAKNEPENILIATMDERRSISLPDGSVIYLNNYSSIEYPEKFRGDLRSVRLDGEAYFEVEKNPGKLFRVDAGGAYVDVLGTEFNVETDKNNNAVNVGVISGKVAFYPATSEENIMILHKDDQAVLSDGIVRIAESPDNNYLSWRTGTLIFENTKMEQVVEDLARHFRKKIIYDNKNNRELSLTSRFENQDMDSVLEELRIVLGINYSIEGDIVSISIE